MKNLLRILFLLLLVSSGCGEGNQKKIDVLFPVSGSQIKLGMDGGLVHLQDYFTEVSGIDSLVFHSSLRHKFDRETGIVQVSVYEQDSIPDVSMMEVYLLNRVYSIPVIKSRNQKVKFRFFPKGINYKSVSIAGDMNGWSPENGKLVFKGGTWAGDLTLNPGEYGYQIVADGVWGLDPEVKETIPNGMGGTNSLLKVGGDFETENFIFLKSFEDNHIKIGFINKPDNFYPIIENVALDPDRIIFHENEIEIVLPAWATRLSRSQIRVFASGKVGIFNDLSIPILDGNPIIDSEKLLQSDKEKMIMYFVLVDRFFNGNEKNDSPLIDKEVADRANYYGGDISGILKKIEEGYFRSLGINTLWISPIVRNPDIGYVEFPAPHRKYSGYHGYWPVSSREIDPRFGNDSIFRVLVDKIHQENMNVLLDLVMNHVHEDNPLIREHPDWATELYLEDSALNIRVWDDQRLTTWFDRFLPSLDFSKQEVIDAQSEIGLYWLTKFNLDGFRHDATKHIPETFWRTLTKDIKEQTIFKQRKSVYQIGETFGSRELIGSYVGSGIMDGQFDFNLYFDARSVFSGNAGSFVKLNQSVLSSLNSYGFHHLMGNISGNHDLPRFISYASGDLKFEEDPKEAGWKRKIEVTDTIGYERLSSLLAFTLTLPGVPAIYYGDEIGMPGGNDPDNRRPMKFEELLPGEEKNFLNTRKLIGLRKSRMSLISGDFFPLLTEEFQYAYARVYLEDVSISVFNQSTSTRDIFIPLPGFIASHTLHSEFAKEFCVRNDTLILRLPPSGFDVLTTEL